MVMAASGDASELLLSTRELGIAIGGNAGFLTYLDVPSNESVEVHAAVPEGAGVVGLPGPAWRPLPAWINVSAIQAGHATVTLNASLPSVSRSFAEQARPLSEWASSSLAGW